MIYGLLTVLSIMDDSQHENRNSKGDIVFKNQYSIGYLLSNVGLKDF